MPQAPRIVANETKVSPAQTKRQQHHQQNNNQQPHHHHQQQQGERQTPPLEVARGGSPGAPRRVRRARPKAPGHGGRVGDALGLCEPRSRTPFSSFPPVKQTTLPALRDLSRGQHQRLFVLPMSLGPAARPLPAAVPSPRHLRAACRAGRFESRD
ncbi:unnamed protein product [Lampetra fluviatilis]